MTEWTANEYLSNPSNRGRAIYSYELARVACKRDSERMFNLVDSQSAAAGRVSRAHEDLWFAVANGALLGAEAAEPKVASKLYTYWARCYIDGVEAW